MSKAPNLLIIVADGMQAESVDPGHFCSTPHLDALSRNGVRFRRAHTTCPTCSPARASFMTGLLPHNHGVLEVEHGRDDDQCVLRTEYPHFAQRLSAAGYRTSYFGKWHIERTQDVTPFGWQEGILKGEAHVRGMGRADDGPRLFDLDENLCGFIEGPVGYRRVLHWGVTDTPLDERYPGLTVLDAERSLVSALGQADPWCICVSFSEPNEALVVGRETWNQYDAAALPLPENFRDDLTDRPNIYQREQAIAASLSEDDWRAARACYFGRISEVDQLVGRLVGHIDAAGQRDETVIVFLADHGRYVGAHGFDAHNFGAFEEIYGIPLIFSGPGIRPNEVSDALVSIADVGPTLCEIAGAAPLESADSASFFSLLTDPQAQSPRFEFGYAEYHGTRFPLMQRVIWHENWKFVFNGFDFDELYDLAADPHEQRNVINEPQHQMLVESLMREIWKRVRDTGDRAIHESHYLSLRLACVGPDAV